MKGIMEVVNEFERGRIVFILGNDTSNVTLSDLEDFLNKSGILLEADIVLKDIWGRESNVKDIRYSFENNQVILSDVSSLGLERKLTVCDLVCAITAYPSDARVIIGI